MNKKLKIVLISTGILVPAFFVTRYFVIKSSMKEAEKRFTEDNTDKKLLIMQILIKKGIPTTETNINSFMNYSIEDLKKLVNTDLDFAYSSDTYGYEFDNYDPYGYEDYGYDPYGYE